MKLLLVFGIAGSIWLAIYLRRRAFMHHIQAGESAIEQTSMEARGQSGEWPPLVQSYLRKVIPRGKEDIHHVRFKQSGFMALQEGPADKPFSAEQVMAVGQPGFSWTAHVSVVPLLNALVCDRLVGSEGSLEARLAGFVPLARESGQAMLKGELLRYLAELPWAPWGFLHLQDTVWREVGPRLWELRLNYQSEAVRILYQFDERDLITSIRVDDRPRSVGRGQTVPTVWLGEFSNYAVHAGILIPQQAEVSWLLDGASAKFTYFKAQIDLYEIFP